MKYEVRFTNSFKKNLKLIRKRGLDISLLEDIILKLANGFTLEERYLDHELSGKYKGFRECHIRPNWILIYLIENDILVLTIVNTGSHSDLLGM